MDEFLKELEENDKKVKARNLSVDEEYQNYIKFIKQNNCKIKDDNTHPTNAEGANE